jgi:hypothetical protein
MANLDTYIHEFMRSVQVPSVRTSLEAALDQAGVGFVAGLKAPAFSSAHLTRLPTTDEFNGAIEQAQFHAHRLGLSLVMLRNLLEASWHANVHRAGEDRRRGRDRANLPRMSTGLRGKIRSRPVKGK